MEKSITSHEDGLRLLGQIGGLLDAHHPRLDGEVEARVRYVALLALAVDGIQASSNVVHWCVIKDNIDIDEGRSIAHKQLPP